MIELNNVSHIYTSKKGSKVIGLKDLNFSFKGRGMYFLTGKSGCGKSTLLNILSGIEKLQSGEILIEGTPMSKFSQTDYDNYRNSYAGIIFQEFNLIENMTVFENIDMALKLQGKQDNANLIAECLEKVDLKGYENRFPSELSGGQRQRITIARQLAKGSRIILADEPTGSLDSVNSKKVFDILKKLSQETLIVVASHDLEFAEEYGDEIITLVDGQIVDVKTKNQITPNTQSNANDTKGSKRKFPASYAFKIALKDIVNTKMRFIVATFLCFVSLAMFAMFVNISSFTSEKAIAYTLVNREDKFVMLRSSYYDEKGLINTNLSHKIPLTERQLSLIDDVAIKCAIVERRFKVNMSKELDRFAGGNDYVAVINSPEDLSLYGYKLASGYLPLSGDNVYITDYYAYVIITSGWCCYVENEALVPIDKDESVYSLVGKTIANSDAQRINVAGIIDTDYQRFMPHINEYDIEKDLEYAEYSFLSKNIYTTLFGSMEYLQSFVINRINLWPDKTLHYGVRSDGKDLDVIRIFNDLKGLEDSDLILYKDDYSTDYNNIKLRKNQIILSLEMYNRIYNESFSADYYFDELREGIVVRNYPSHVGQKINLELYKKEYFEDESAICELKDLEVVGIYFGPIEHMPFFCVGDEDIKFFAKNTTYYTAACIPVKQDRGYMAKLLGDLRNEYVLADNHFTQQVYEFKSSFSLFKDIFIVFGSILLVFSIVIFANFITVSIVNRKKDIGIIRAIGGSGKNIFQIFLSEGLVFVALVSLLAIVSSLILTLIMNGILVKSMVKGMILLMFNALNLIIIPIACLVIMLITTFFPINGISRRSPVQIIRNN